MSTPKNCRRCARPMSPRGDARTRGLVEHDARGLCSGCCTLVRRKGEIDKYPLGNDRHGYMIENFRFIAETGGGTRTATRIGWDRRTREIAAARLGVNVGALDRALWRDAQRRAA